MRKPLSEILFLLQVAALAAACKSGAPPDSQGQPAVSYRGTMRPACAPHDAASVELRLESAVGRETVTFNLWPRTPVWPPMTVRFDPHHPIGAATFCDADGDCQQAEWGEVRLVSSDQGTGVTGGWAIGLTGGGARQGTFEAEWLAIQAFCG